ncbi:MAG: prepilin-type N-terminal cleavage/methylation domain-containing protein [Elusimicrobiales bacterium]|nr:prepilin-type N-terminal cleavage/methylation domain-containing protein [Elusimicrobiales bacterium]
MYKNTGFTLIELLVVVLIIGILSSVALPQYRLAVQKTRTMRLMSLLRSISDAENVYYMANGTYTLQFDDLDIGMPGGGSAVGGTGSRLDYEDFYCHLRCDTADNSFSAYCNDNSPGAPNLEKYFSRDSFICWGRSEGSLAWRVCQNVSGKTSPDVTSNANHGTTGFSF